MRLFFTLTAAWYVNSAAHLFGSQPFATSDASRNNRFVNIAAVIGEGWHNNHHAFPTSARHGLFWWQFDSSYLVIRAMGALGLAKNIRTPSPAAILRSSRQAERNGRFLAVMC